MKKYLIVFLFSSVMLMNGEKASVPKLYHAEEDVVHQEEHTRETSVGFYEKKLRKKKSAQPVVGFAPSNGISKKKVANFGSSSIPVTKLGNVFESLSGTLIFGGKSNEKE
ncbi:hypothetical protein [Enterococcus thailandicus]|uniref:hypothetical protein n=1 Tax=Enterococcus TaxID=1350 RepID=UPI001C4BD8C7|nr:hypothetical protein [Enterococcus thailandicus]